MIIVEIYRDAGMVGRGRTDGEGKYEVTVPRGAPMTVRFDTTPTLANAREWHPAVAANIDAQHNMVFDRFLGKGRSMDGRGIRCVVDRGEIGNSRRWSPRPSSVSKLAIFTRHLWQVSFGYGRRYWYSRSLRHNLGSWGKYAMRSVSYVEAAKTA